MLGASVWAGCSSAGEDVDSAEGAATAGTTCRVLDRQAGGEMTDAKFKALVDSGDPIAKKILAGECQKSLSAVFKKLEGEKDCNIGTNGLGSYLISETAAFESKTAAANNGFRTVITKDCEGRNQTGMLFSGFANKGQISEEGVEMIGRSTAGENAGVFNYYELNGDGSYTFFGNSKDFVTNGYKCDAATGTCSSNNTAQGKPGTGSNKMCGSCHVSGGLIMKELASPWLHWTAGFPTGSEDVVKAHKQLGEQQIGENLEFNVVRTSFDDYNTNRAKWLAAKGAKELLRPIACTLDVNVDSGLFSGSIVASTQLGFGSLNLDQATYNKVKKALGQKLEGVGKDDTAFEFTYPRKGEIDENYAEKLVAAGLIDENMLAGILGVDFTRPVFSGKRCQVVEGLGAGADAALATWADKPTAANATKVKSEIKKLLPAEVGGAKKADVEAKVTAFFAKCNERLEKEKEVAMEDILSFAATQRKNMKAMRGQNGARNERLIEDPSTMLVTDDTEKTNKNGKRDLAFDADCKLTVK